MSIACLVVLLKVLMAVIGCELNSICKCAPSALARVSVIYRRT